MTRPSRRRRLNVGASEIGSPVRAGGPQTAVRSYRKGKGQATLAVWPKTPIRNFVAVQRHAVAPETLSLDERISVTRDMLSETFRSDRAQRREELCQFRQKKLPPILAG